MTTMLPIRALLISWVSCMTVWGAGASRFEDDFRGGPASGWTVLRERSDAWRIGERGLEVRALPGNLWGPANDAPNTWVRPAPDPEKGPVTVTVEVENRPTEQYEQVNLVWYYDDGHQVKLGQEMVDGKLCIVMGREEGDRTRTIAIVPIEADAWVVEVRFEVEGRTIRGLFRMPGSEDWREAGVCDLPVKGEPKISLQVYQGTDRVERWARFGRFRMEQRRE
ncbi:MAG: hypothetical protein KF833_18995 [Verrucomicrobiae bacterium]|nr:hypothetical protein [Verrucomicrobiae bacterium]